MKRQINSVSERNILDFHSHILPAIDDGSSDLETSLAMLEALAAQGVKRVVATPHFDASLYSPDEFLRRRDNAEKKLREAVENRGDATLPRLYIGAEVAYFSGMSKSEAIKSLCIGETELMLLEMPFFAWSESAVDEVLRIREETGITPVLAHVERYFSFQKKGVLESLLYEGIPFQVNAEAFISLTTRRRALKMLSEGDIAFLGSDCHGILSRAPNFDKAFEVVKKKGLEDELLDMFAHGNEMFDDLEVKGNSDE